jgi:hypothetical protein
MEVKILESSPGFEFSTSSEKCIDKRVVNISEVNLKFLQGIEVRKRFLY